MSVNEMIKNDEEMNQEMIKQQIAFLNHERKKNKLRKSLSASKISILKLIVRTMNEGLYKELDDVITHCKTLIELHTKHKDEVMSSTKIICTQIDNQQRLLKEFKIQLDEDEEMF